MLDVAAAQFTDQVEEDRIGIDIDVIGTGKMFFAKEALNNGLIDKIGDRQAAIARLQELISNQNTSGIKSVIT